MDSTVHSLDYFQLSAFVSKEELLTKIYLSQDIWAIFGKCVPVKSAGLKDPVNLIEKYGADKI